MPQNSTDTLCMQSAAKKIKEASKEAIAKKNI